jgi:surface protein
MPPRITIITDNNIGQFISYYLFYKEKLPYGLKDIPIGKWDVSRITNMSELFQETQFNEDISEWNVSNVENMSGMFRQSSFNGSIENWNVSKVETMNGMFDNAYEFNQPLNRWGDKTANVKDMSGMFYVSPKFNQPLNNWNISNVTNMSNMFEGALSFNQDLSDWKLSNDVNILNMFRDAIHFDIKNTPRSYIPSHSPVNIRDEIDLRINMLVNLPPVGLEKSNLSILPTDTVYDYIEGEDINAIDYLKQDKNNIVFKCQTTCYGINKEVLLKAAKSTSNIFYGCSEPDSKSYPVLNDIALEEPFFKLNSIGVNIGGLLMMSELKNILINPSYNAFEIIEEPIHRYNETTSLYSITMDNRDEGNNEWRRISNTTHCAPGSSENVYGLKYIEPRISGGYKRRPRVSKRKKSKRRKYTKKRL